MKKTKDIKKTETIIEHIAEGESDLEYIVSGGAYAIIVLSALKVTHASARVRVRLTGRNAKADIMGIVIAGGDSVFALHTIQQHEAPETMSNLLVKTVLKDRAASAYDGGIRVEKVAQKTDAYQRNENLILSDTAHAQSKPALEILANDVRCTHGATVGPISREQLWYLTTRGISQAAAAALIVEGFLMGAVEKLSDSPAKETLWKEIQSAL